MDQLKEYNKYHIFFDNLYYYNISQHYKVKILVSLITCIFCGSLTYTAIFTIEYSIGIGERTESLFFFMWPFHLCLAIGLGLSSLVAFLQTIEDVHKYTKGDHFRETVEAATDV